MKRVLIVEDDLLVSQDVEQALTAAGYDVCGVASNEAEALSMARAIHPDFAVVDVNLSPGDGRRVARELTDRYETTVLMATGHCGDKQMMSGYGARACLPKPYSSEMVAAALETTAALRAGDDPGELPDHMVVLNS
jgi:DNA-binding response OmpR family regulator